ncbi:MAG: SDR family NAD(P)-dependent oxidoreductase [Pseudomonadales bacterium]|nr:SDR family NAD(P)-dependent oxidoreductase [Pseudomonadales bacterium]MCP5183853.1 SDR family NAD(P)-dependent oxidoreductase [Pseudomonadales bacterium]
MGKLDGKVAIVTGAGGGLGRCHALGLAAEGAAVVVNDLGGARDGTGGGHSMADAVVAEIKAAGGRAVAQYGNVADAADAADLVKTAVDAFGRLDIVINNAGILRDRTFKKITHEEWDAVIAVHLRGTYLVTRAAWDVFMAQGEGGRIVNTSSTSGLIGNFGQTNYGAAKAGIAGFTRVLALEGMKYGITVNTLAPAAWTRMTEDLMPTEQAQPMAPEKVSPVVVWLCTEDAANVTGRQFCVGSNRITLLSWQVTPIGQHDPKAAPWTVDEVDAAMKASQANWPKLLRLSDV